jgi:hypothetical protein
MVEVPEDVLSFSQALLCGCMPHDEAFAVLRGLLLIYPAEAYKSFPWIERVEEAKAQVGGSEPVLYLLLGFLDHLDLTEHGTSIRFGWLTPKGEAVRNWLEAHPAFRPMKPPSYGLPDDDPPQVFSCNVKCL